MSGTRVWPLPRLTFRELNSVQESRLTALITQPDAWGSVRARLNLPLVVQAEPTRDDADFFEYLADNLPTAAQVIYAVGDGLPIDAAKMVAQRSHKPLVIVPTALSSDLPFSASSSARAYDRWHEHETGPAEEVILDLEFLRTAPPHLRTAGIADVLSVVTALMDWGYAAQKGKTTPETQMVGWAVPVAAGIAAQAVKNAQAIAKADAESLRMLVDLLCLTLQLDSQLGHRRASRGTEHLFADALRERGVSASVSHAEMVAPGILVTSALYGKDSSGLRTALEGAGVRLSQIPVELVKATLNALPEFAQKVNAPYSIVNELAPNAPELAAALSKSTLFAEKPA